jgi:hypothetical protein
MNQKTHFLQSIIICAIFLFVCLPLNASDEVAVCLAPDGQIFPWVVSDGEGGVVVVWEDYRTGKDWDVYAQRVDASGETLWEKDGVPISVKPNNQRYLRMVRSGDRSVVAWTDRRVRTNWDVYAQAIDPSGKPLWTEGGVPVCVNRADQSTLDALSDNSGGVIVVWEDERRNPAAHDLYVQRIGADGKPMWEVDGIPVFPSESVQSNPKLIADDTGGFYIVWWDVVGYDRWHIMAHRLDLNGTPVWKAPIVVSPTDGMQGDPRTIEDGAGGLIVVWQDYAGFINDDFYAQRVAPDGNKRWGERGVTLCNASGIQKHASIVGDGSGGLIAVWRDERDVYGDLYAQHINADGKPQWTANGVAICTAGGHQDKPFVVRRDNGQFFVAWVDFRDDYGEESQNAIYGQQFDLSGKILWDPEGTPICTAKGEQHPPFVVRLASGELAVVWSDTRRDMGDIYLRRF